jgi:hypothetical protein
MEMFSTFSSTVHKFHSEFYTRFSQICQGRYFAPQPAWAQLPGRDRKKENIGNKEFFLNLR